MSRLLTLVAVVLLALATGCSRAALPQKSDVDFDTPALREAKQAAGIDDCVPGTGQPVEGGLPAITLPCLGGGPDVDLATLRGPMVVSLWAQSCGPCRTEMPILQSFYETYGDRVPVLGIDYLDTLPGFAIGFMDQAGATYPSVADVDGDISAKAGVPVIRALPNLLFVDAKGVITHILPEDVKSEKELKNLVATHLGVAL